MNLKLYLLFALALALASCTTTNTAGDDSFYGYDNTPEREAQEKPEPPQEEWINPLADEDVPQNTYRTERMQVNNYYYGNAGYVPVIAPWYVDYYGWGAPVRHRRGGVFVSFGAYRFNEWYAPWYNFHPYYGCSWYDYYYMRPHYRAWYNQPIYAYSPNPRSSWRYWGNNRGVRNLPVNNNPRNNRGFVNTRTYNPRSARLSSRTNSTYNSRNSSYSGRQSGSQPSSNSGRYSSPQPTNSNNGNYRNSGSSSNNRSGSSSSGRKSGGSYQKGSSSKSSGRSSGSSRNSGGNRGSSSSGRRR